MPSLYMQGFSSPWDSVGWDQVTLKQTLDNLMVVEPSKMADLVTAVVYSNLKLASEFVNALTQAGFKNVHTVQVSRFDHSFEVVSSSVVVVGTYSGRNIKPKASQSMSLQFLLPDTTDNTSTCGRPDMQGCYIDKSVLGVRRRTVEEFRHFVRVYSSQSDWVVGMHVGDASCMLAALLEGRSVLGYEPNNGRVGLAYWRLSMFQRTEGLINEVLPIRDDSREDAAIVDAVTSGDLLAKTKESFETCSLSCSEENMSRLCTQINKLLSEGTYGIDPMTNEGIQVVLTAARTQFLQNNPGLERLLMDDGKIYIYSYITGFGRR